MTWIADGKLAAAVSNGGHVGELAVALMLGACGVQMGTRFLSAEECTIHPVYKQKILKAIIMEMNNLRYT